MSYFIWAQYFILWIIWTNERPTYYLPTYLSLALIYDIHPYVCTKITYTARKQHTHIAHIPRYN